MVSETHRIQRDADETPTKSDNSNMSLLPRAPLSPLEKSLPFSENPHPSYMGTNSSKSESSKSNSSTSPKEKSLPPHVLLKIKRKGEERDFFRKFLSKEEKFEEKEVEG